MDIDIWMDITCPFCYIGTTQLEQALGKFEYKNEVKIQHHSFQLDPEAPLVTEKNLHETLATKKGISIQEAEQLNAYVATMAASVGLSFHFEKVIPVNSFDAHRLIHFAAKHNKESKIIQRLFKAYFEDGSNIASQETLAILGSGVGLDAETIKNSLQSDEYRDAVRNDISQALAYGIHGVPFFIINKKYTVSGAQGVDAFTEVLQKAWDEKDKE